MNHQPNEPIVSKNPIVRAAHAARQGMKDSMATRRARALSRHRLGIGIGPYEVIFSKLLDAAGIEYLQQTPHGPYCLDFSLTEHPVAVEIRTGGGNAAVGAKKKRRLKYVLDKWNLFEVNCRNPLKTIEPVVVEYLVAYCQILSANESVSGHYWMIRSDGRPMFPTPGCVQHDTRTPVLSPNDLKALTIGYKR